MRLQALSSVIHLLSLSRGSRARARGPARIALNAKSKQLSLEFIVRYLTASLALVFPSSNLHVYSSLQGFFFKKNTHPPLSSTIQTFSVTLSCKPACEADRGGGSSAADPVHVGSGSLCSTRNLEGLRLRRCVSLLASRAMNLLAVPCGPCCRPAGELLPTAAVQSVGVCMCVCLRKGCCSLSSSILSSVCRAFAEDYRKPTTAR